MRKSPSERSEVVSQALFAEDLLLHKTEGAWSLVETSDRYLGWVLSSFLTDALESYKPTLYTTGLATHLYAAKDIAFGPIETLPFGIGLLVLEDTDPTWFTVLSPTGEPLYVRKGTLGDLPRLPKKALARFAHRFLELPYTWGGRSSFGFDCSGFVQMLYQRLGILLARDSKDQIRSSHLQLKDIASLEAGDLVFWGTSSQEIRHVALFLQGQEFIHTSARENMPWLRLSLLTDEVWSGESHSVYPYRIGAFPLL
jgi:hypothetical protein